MKAKSVKRLGILVASIGVIAGLGFGVRQLQVGRLAKSVVEVADLAEKELDFRKAERLYSQRLQVMPNDVEVMLKYADLLSKMDNSPNTLRRAYDHYTEVLNRSPGREDARRSLADLAVRNKDYLRAQRDVAILLKAHPDDGELHYMMGLCTEDEKVEQNANIAVGHFRDAIEFKSPHLIEAYQHWAALLRDRLHQPQEANKKIEEMVQANPNDYRVYLERGLYLRRLASEKGVEDRESLRQAKEALHKALELAPSEPMVSIELAKTEELDTGGHDAARTTLESALEKSPKSIELYIALFQTEVRANRIDEAVGAIELGLKALPEHPGLHYTLALLRAMRGEASKLLLKIEDMKAIGFPDSEPRMKYLLGYYQFLSNNFLKARQILGPLQSQVSRDSDMRAKINTLLARCYGQSNDLGQQQSALERAVSANGEDLTARLALAELKARRGAIESAIDDYRKLLGQYPRYVRLPLAQTLILQNTIRPPAQRTWDEAESLVAAAERDEPQASLPVIVRSRLLEERGQPSPARDLLETLRGRTPKDAAVWSAEVSLLQRQRKVDEALALLDEAQKQVGDRVELRLQRASLWLAKGGPTAIATLQGLARNVGSYSRYERRVLLATIANELRRLGDVPGAVQLWSQIAQQDPNDIEPFRNLIELGLQGSDKDAIEKNILDLEKLDAPLSRYFQAKYLIWRAERSTVDSEQEALCAAARTLLNDLGAGRPDWSLIPLALAMIEELELRKLEAGKKPLRPKQEALLVSYNRALDLREVNSSILRRIVQLLFATGQGNEALALYNRYPLAAQLAGDLGRLTAQVAIENKDFQKAEEIARKAVAANPNDYRERIFLVQILLASSKLDEAEAELRRSIDLSKTEPDRWTNLVNFFVITRQPKKGEKAVRDAEAALPAATSAYPLALCCKFMGRGYENGEPEAAKKWFDEATSWYEKAVSSPPAQADSLLMTRRLIEFLIETKQIAAAEARLNTLLSANKKDASNAALLDWARRKYALALVTGGARDRVQKAVALFEPAGQPPRDPATADPDDLRVLARVLEVQGSPENHKRAMETLEALVKRNVADPDDRYMLARLQELGGDWEQSREQYRELILRTDRPRDLETLNRRPVYLTQFASSLLAHRKTDGSEAIEEARQMLEKLRQIQPDGLNTLMVALEIDRAREQNETGAERIRAWVDRPNVNPRILLILAGQSEQFGRLDLAEQLLRRARATAPSEPQYTLGLARFLGRHNSRTKDALDLCESLWANPVNRNLVAGVAIEIILGPDSTEDPAQLKRVSGWVEQAIAAPQAPAQLILGLGTLRDQEGRYDDAMQFYRRALERDGRESIALNNLAWLVALKDGKPKEALPLVNQALAIKGQIPDFLDTRGVVYLVDGDIQHAIADFEAATAKVSATSGSRLFHLAQAYHQAKNDQKAKEVLEAAKTKGLPNGLHPLEQPAYNRLLSELK
jgi:tetratricopeptide (TPR) repeat protein